MLSERRSLNLVWMLQYAKRGRLDASAGSGVANGERAGANDAKPAPLPDPLLVHAHKPVNGNCNLRQGRDRKLSTNITSSLRCSWEKNHKQSITRSRHIQSQGIMHCILSLQAPQARRASNLICVSEWQSLSSSSRWRPRERQAGNLLSKFRF